MATIDQAEVMLNLWLLEQAWQPNKVQAPVLCCPGPDGIDGRPRFIDVTPAQLKQERRLQK
jgi:hypothetical protein